MGQEPRALITGAAKRAPAAGSAAVEGRRPHHPEAGGAAGLRRSEPVGFCSCLERGWHRGRSGTGALSSGTETRVCCGIPKPNSGGGIQGPRFWGRCETPSQSLLGATAS